MEHTLLNTIKFVKMLKSLKPAEITSLLKAHGINKTAASMEREGGLEVEMFLMTAMNEKELTVELTPNELKNASQQDPRGNR